MPASHQKIGDLLCQLRCGSFDAENAGFLEQMSADELVSDLQETHPVLFQERSIGRKHEVGMARALRFEFSSRQSRDSLFPAVHLVPILWRCVFVSSYGNAISEITMTASVRVRPAWGVANEAVLKLGSGFKLDKTPDGWVGEVGRTTNGYPLRRILAEKGLEIRGVTAHSGEAGA